MSLDKACFTAAVVSLGVKGYLQIEEDDDDFTLHRQDEPGSGIASPGEQAVFDALLPAGYGSIELEHKNHKEFRAASSGLKEALADEYKGRLFNLNLVYTVPAMLTSVLAGIVAIPLHGSPLMWVAYPVLTIALHVIFVYLLRAPTISGRRVMDEIEGFRMYLATAERDRLEQMRSPQLTAEAFEMFLPFAFALGVENSWCQRFENEFPPPEDGSGGYHPAWYSGHLARAGALSHISSDLGSGLSSAISSASTPPGSSSGSGGGGFSGGGGGGGGGGGW